jgi:hypothetical protein
MPERPDPYAIAMIGTVATFLALTHAEHRALVVYLNDRGLLPAEWPAFEQAHVDATLPTLIQIIGDELRKTLLNEAEREEERGDPGGDVL